MVWFICLEKIVWFLIEKVLDLFKRIFFEFKKCILSGKVFFFIIVFFIVEKNECLFKMIFFELRKVFLKSFMVS